MVGKGGTVAVAVEVVVAVAVEVGAAGVADPQAAKSNDKDAKR
jgi:hypothetical protein